MTSVPVAVEIPGIGQITGPMLLGHLFNYALLGVLSIQVYIYCLSFPHDKAHIRALVYFVFFVDILQTCFASHYAWYVLASGWGDPSVLRITPWTLAAIPPLAGIIACVVQLFFTWRIWILGQGNKLFIPFLLLIAVAAVGSCVAAFYSGVVSAAIRDVAKAYELDTPVTVWLAGSMACDVVIAVTLVYQLSSRKSEGFSSVNHILHRASRMAIETGAVTSVIVIIELVLFLQSALTSWYFMLGMVIGKVYSNSLLATLNSRSKTFQGSRMTGIQESANVWQVREIATGDGTLTNSMGTSKKDDIELGNVHGGQNPRRYDTKARRLNENEDYPAFPPLK